jgi:hypothetical protein
MSVGDNLNTIKRYRSYGLWGGLFLGTLIGILIGGPQFREWQTPLKTWGIVVACCSAVGAITGFIFFSLLGPGVGQSTYDLDGSCGGGDGGGDGGGGD